MKDVNAPIQLTNRTPGETLVITAIDAGRGAVIHLTHLGLQVGDRIVLKRRSLFKGPVVVTHRDTDIAIGHGLARRIMVEPV